LNKKHTYTYWVRYGDKPFESKYYEFKTFKVYWAYRWFIARELSNVGIYVTSAFGGGGSMLRSNFVERYE
jgi:hypothetical protein